MPLMSGGGGAPKDPLVSVNFFVSIDGLPATFMFRECSGIGSEHELVEWRESGKDDFHSIRMVPGRLKWTPISLKGGVSDSMDLWNWRKQCEEGQVSTARKNGSIVMVDQTGSEVARWNFINAWPRKISGPSVNATTNEIGVEELEIVHEKLTRIK